MRRGAREEALPSISPPRPFRPSCHPAPFAPVCITGPDSACPCPVRRRRGGEMACGEGRRSGKGFLGRRGRRGAKKSEAAAKLENARRSLLRPPPNTHPLFVDAPIVLLTLQPIRTIPPAPSITQKPAANALCCAPRRREEERGEVRVQPPKQFLFPPARSASRPRARSSNRVLCKEEPRAHP